MTSRLGVRVRGRRDADQTQPDHDADPAGDVATVHGAPPVTVAIISTHRCTRSIERESVAQSSRDMAWYT
jgi:hypothetical protein